MNDRTSNQTRPYTRYITLLFLLLGPLGSIALLDRLAGGVYLPGDVYPYAAVAALLMWSPMPFSITSTILFVADDPVEKSYGNTRGTLPSRLLGSSAPARVRAAAGLLGFVMASALFLALV